MVENLAKPSIPTEAPQRREVPEIPSPIPERPIPDSSPAPIVPVGPQRQPVPAGR